VGVDRSRATGTGYTGQYPLPWRDVYESVGTCPDELLLFFHHVPYDHCLRSGTTVIQHIYDSHFEGVERVGRMIEQWRRVQGRVSDAVYERVDERLAVQLRSAQDWRDTVNTYFFRRSGMSDRHSRPIP
jgi:alpha-glucuronidase